MSERGDNDLFERMVERVLSYRPKSKRKKKAKRKTKVAKKKQK
jgi:hypothetical protein